MAKHNPMCDGDKCLSESGEVRVLPLNGDANLIVCQSCHAHEMRYRRDMNKNLSKDAQWDLPEWENLKVYNP